MWLLALVPALVAQLAIAPTLLTGQLAGINVDEALHAVYADAVLHDLAHGDFHDLLLDITDQVRWPPLGSLLQLPGLLIFGTSEAGHRLALLLWLLPVAAVVAWTARQLGAASAEASHDVAGAATGDRDGESVCLPAQGLLAAAVAVGLLVTSRTALIASASVLYEIPGVGLMLLTYCLAAVAWRRRDTRLFAVAGLALAAAGFTKWQYGLVTTVALAVPVVFAFRHRSSRLPGVHVAWLFGPAFVLLALWLASPYHLREIVLYFLWRPASVETLASNLVKAAVVFARAPLLTQGLTAVTVAGLVLAVPLLGRPLGLMLMAHLALAMVGSLPKDFSLRTALWIALPAWAVAGAGWARAAGRLPRGALVPVAVLVVLLGCGGAGGTAAWVSQRLVDRGQHAGLWYRAEAQYLASTIPFGARLLTVGGWWRFISPYHIRRQQLLLYWDRPFSLRALPVTDWPSVEWEPWHLRWKGVRALLGLRRGGPHPPRRREPPDYVAALYLPEGNPGVAQGIQDVAQEFRLVRQSVKTFPTGSRVVLYRCLGKVQKDQDKAAADSRAEADRRGRSAPLR
ncbi:MAG: hypothetical protein J7M26_02835 [Armatimonadetes bacterium]|nr:hypothetical protein [Armatimonadota bacterium]